MLSVASAILKKLYSLSAAPEPLVFWYKKLEGQDSCFPKNFWVVYPAASEPSPGSFWEEAGRRFFDLYPFGFCRLLVTGGFFIPIIEHLLFLFVRNLSFEHYSPLLLCSFVLFLFLSRDLLVLFASDLL